MKSLLLTSVAVLSLCGAAIAQTATTPKPAETTPDVASSPSSQPMKPMSGSPAASSSTAPEGTTGMGMKMADTATVAVRFVTVSPAELMSSKLIGTNVYNNQNESLGEVEDLVIKQGQTISGVVVSVGGFLGIGESYVVLDPATVVLNEKDGKWRAFVDTSKDTLKNAPKFSYKKMNR